MDSPAQAPSGTRTVTRRTVTGTAIWVMPVIAFAAAAPSATASQSGGGQFAVPDVVIRDFVEFSNGGFTAGFDFDSIAPIAGSTPTATIDWSTFDLDPTTPGVQQTLVLPVSSQPGRVVNVAFDPSTRLVTVQMLFATDYTSIAPIQYQVQDSNGVLSTVGTISINLPA